METVSFWREEMGSVNSFYVSHAHRKEARHCLTLQSHGSCHGLLSWCCCVTHTGAEITKPSTFHIYLNTEVSEFQIQLDLFCLWILSFAVITSLIHSKGEKEIHSIPNRASLAWPCIKHKWTTKLSINFYLKQIILLKNRDKIALMVWNSYSSILWHLLPDMLG